MKKLLTLLSTLLLACNSSSSETIPDSVQQFINQSVEGLKQQESAHSATWHFGEEETWSVDQDSGLIHFVFSDKIATAPVQIVGTYNPKDGTFMWGWDNPSVDNSLSRAASLVRQYGEKNKVSLFTQKEIKCTQDQAWEFTALTARLDNSNGAYRVKTSGPVVYMVFGEIKLEKSP